MSDSPLQLHLSLKGRPLRKYTFVQESISIGRDPQSDVLIENIGVSRNQAQILRTPEGWVLQDSKSANGTWHNGHRVERALLNDGDEIVVGKFALQVGLAREKRTSAGCGTAPRPAAPYDGTTVLTQGQLARVLEMARTGELDGQPEPTECLPERDARSATLRRRLIVGLALIAAMGAGGALTALLLR